MRFWSRGKHNRSRRGHVTAYRAVRRNSSGHAFGRVITSSPKSRLRFDEYRFYPIVRSGILLIFSYGTLLQMISILLRVTLFLGVTYNKIRNVQIHNTSNRYT